VKTWWEVVGFYPVLCKMKERTDFFVLIFFGFFVLGCTETHEVNTDAYGTDYFPLEVGQFAIYQVEGVEYINPQDSVEFSYQLKESITESFEDLEMGISYKILREKRENENDDWKTDSIWTARKDEIQAIKTENNVPYVRLVFPLKENKTWNGNALNGKEFHEYEMINVHKPFEGKFSSFDRSVTVIQDLLPDMIVQNKLKKEVYSQHIGLVYKEKIILNFRQGDDTGLEIVDSGIKYFQSILTYGEE
jgi:hypothetical protein